MQPHHGHGRATSWWLTTATATWTSWHLTATAVVVTRTPTPMRRWRHACKRKLMRRWRAPSLRALRRQALSRRRHHTPHPRPPHAPAAATAPAHPPAYGGATHHDAVVAAAAAAAETPATVAPLPSALRPHAGRQGSVHARWRKTPRTHVASTPRSSATPCFLGQHALAVAATHTAAAAATVARRWRPRHLVQRSGRRGSGARTGCRREGCWFPRRRRVSCESDG